MSKRASIADDTPEMAASGRHFGHPSTHLAEPSWQASLAAAAVAIFAASVFFFHLGVYGLWEPDEARYAEIGREMLVLHDFVVPHLNFVPYVEKPPLLYWLTASAMEIFGVNAFAARLVNAAAAVVGALAVYYFALRVFSLRHAISAATILATSALYAVMAQVLTTDMLLTASVTVALFAFFLHWREGDRWCWLGYIAMGLGVLTKGPIGVMMPLATVALFLALERDLRRAAQRFHVIGGFAVTIAIAAPWFLAISIRQPDFIRFYFIGEHLQRFFEASYSHGEPFYYYLPVLLGGALPWTFVAILVPWRSLEPNPARRYCMIAVTVTVVVFSCANAKLIPYILPAVPPLAVVIADGVLASSSDLQRMTVSGPLISLAGVGTICAAAFADHFASANPAMVQPELYAAGAIMLVAGAVIFIFFLRQLLVPALAAIAIASAAVLIVASYGRVRLEATRSYAQLGREIARRAPDSPLICYPRYIQSLPFYTGRRAILVGPKTELDYGASHAPDADEFFFSSRADLLRLWNATPPPLLIVDRWALPSLGRSLGSYRVIASDAKKVALMRAQPPTSQAR